MLNRRELYKVKEKLESAIERLSPSRDIGIRNIIESDLSPALEAVNYALEMLD